MGFPVVQLFAIMIPRMCIHRWMTPDMLAHRSFEQNATFHFLAHVTDDGERAREGEGDCYASEFFITKPSQMDGNSSRVPLYHLRGFLHRTVDSVRPLAECFL